MRIVIVGASRFGVATAEELLDRGHEVVLVDRDAERLSRLSEQIDAGFLEGDGSLPSVLRDAFGDGADALVALTNFDDVNILASLVARSVGFERVIPQIVRRELLAVCEELGLENLITPHASVARSIARQLEHSHDAALDLTARSGFEVLGYRVVEAMDGQRVDDLDLPDETRIIAVERDGADRVVDGRTRLHEGDLVILAAAPGDHAKLDALFGTNDDEG